MKKIKFEKRGNQLFAHVNDLTISEWYCEGHNMGSIDFLIKSLENDGFSKPLTINMYAGRQGVILDGVQTLKACIALEISMVPVFLVYKEPEQEAAMHVLLNQPVNTLTEEQKRELMKARYYRYFGDDTELLKSEPTTYQDVDEVTDMPVDTSAIMNEANNNYKKSSEKDKRKLIRRCVFILPPEYRDYPEQAMDMFGVKNLTSLYIKLLKLCVEGEANEAA